MTYVKVEIREDIHHLLKQIAKHRGLNIQSLLEEFIEENVDECELDEIFYLKGENNEKDR